jgi:hypothetical protein
MKVYSVSSINGISASNIGNIDTGIFEITKTELDVLISTNSLKPGCTYKINGCDISTYGSTGVTITLQALSNNRLSLSGTVDPMVGIITIADYREVLYNYTADLISDYGIEKGNYNYFKTLISESKLIPEKSYILSEYVHKYYIQNTNTDPVIRYRTITAIVANFAVFNFGYVYDIPSTVTIYSVPTGYTGTVVVGSTTTVTYGDNYYFRFSNNMHTDVVNTGIVITYVVPRYTTLSELSAKTVYDVHGKIQMKPGGVLNTDVHDGTVYGDMTALENKKPPIESILLKAKSENSFYEDCISLTFKNDKLIYDFNNSKILNDNSQQIGTRNGWISRRYNDVLRIDINKDWRAQRSRRWLLPVGPTSSLYRNKLLNIDYPNTNPNTSFQGKYLFTSDLMTTTSTQNMYICSSIESSSITSGPFASVVSFSISMDIIGSTSSTPGGTSSITRFKDYPIFALNELLDPVDVFTCKVSELANSVFLNVNSTRNFKLVLDTESSVNNSTFFGYPQIYDKRFNSNTFNVFDSITVNGYNNTFSSTNVLSLSIFTSDTSSISSSIIGSMANNNYLSNMGGLVSNTTARWIFANFKNTTFTSCLIGGGYPTITIIDSSISSGSIFHYGGLLRIINNILSNVNFESYYSQTLYVNDAIMSNKNIELSQSTPGIVINADSTQALFYRTSYVQVPANTTVRYYDPITKLWVLSDKQLIVSTTQDANANWNGKTIIFNTSCTITLSGSASLVDSYFFNGITTTGVIITWAITSPKTWLFGTPSNTIERQRFTITQQGSTNNIIYTL